MKKIVLCVDGSTESVKAARFLSRLVHDERYELVVLSILPQPETHGIAGALLDDQRTYIQGAYENVEQIFAGANVSIRQLIRFGRPGKKIVSVAKALDADLVVLGAVGHSMVARMLLGSTSDYVATHAESSVLVVRVPDTKWTFDSKPLLSIGLAYEQTGPARAAFEEISEFHWGDKTQFNLLTVIPNRVEFTDDAEISSQKQREQAQDCIDDLRDEFSEVAPVSLGFLLEGTHAGEAIVHFAESHGADLMVVGESKQTNVSRALLGSVSRFVLRHAPCSVWITRNRNIKGVSKGAASMTTKSKTVPATN